MSEIYMTLCDACAERLDAEKHPENKYYLEAIRGSRRLMTCPMCARIAECMQYNAESKETRAMRRALEKRKQSPVKKDHRARWREPWRER